MADPLDQVTPLLLTCNEEANIGRTLAGLSWARRVVVIDSGSSDRTLQILAGFPRVEVHTRPFDSHARQWNHGLEQIRGGWVLSLDADYQITPALRREMAAALKGALPEVGGFRIPFRYYVAGRPLRGTVLPPRIALFRQAAGHYIDDGHTQDLVLQGQCGTLREPILHDDRKPLHRWLEAQRRYLPLEVQKLRATPRDQLSRADRLRQRHVIAPFAVLLLCLLWHRGLLDGWRGWYYAFQRMLVELLLSLMLWEARCDGAGGDATFP
ncbi:MAG: glycosyltransferase family 2 protein [Cyanobacteria bacterium J06638_7]